ncbi:MAG TPA: protease inhibitor I42 family protein [Thermoanaerobaculia bacterium]|jgi:inhibitor of cysteine peptidase|nr:protease inhibitor I42 family protein [Thermoanaerobaculia bacterium]
MQLDEQTANGRTFDLERDEPITLYLNENPSTGYRWHITADPAIEIQSNEFVRGQATGIGAAGQRIVVFRATAPGELHVRAKLWRDWQGESSVIRRCELLVRTAA